MRSGPLPAAHGCAVAAIPVQPARFPPGHNRPSSAGSPGSRACLTIIVKDSLAVIAPVETAIGPPSATARRLVDASVSVNTRRAYAGALGQLDAWLAGQKLDDAALAAYLAELHDAGRAASSAATAVAAARFRARLAGQSDPAGERTARVLAGYRRTAGDRGRGQARPFSAADLAAVLATCHLPRRRGRGVESDQVAAARGRVDAVIAGLLFMGGLRRSEVSALRWADVADAGDADGILVTVRRSKTNQVGETNDVRYLKNGAARAVRTLRSATSPKPADRVVPLSAQMIGATVYGRGRGGRHRAPGDRPLRNGRCSRTGLHRKHEPGDCGLSSTARSLDRAPPAPPSQQPGRTLLFVDRQGPMDRRPDPGAAAQSPSPPRSR